MNAIDLVGLHPRIEQASNSYKKSFKKRPPRAMRLASFLNSDDFQFFCKAEGLEENSLIQFCFNSDEEIRILFGGRVLWMDGMSYRQNLEVLKDVKAPKFIERLSRREQSVFFMSTYWLSRSKDGVWQAELLLDDDGFLQAATCENAFFRLAELLGCGVSSVFTCDAEVNEKSGLYRFMKVVLPQGKERLLAISFDNGALFMLEPEAVKMIPNRRGLYDVYRTTYNWFRSTGYGNFTRIL